MPKLFFFIINILTDISLHPPSSLTHRMRRFGFCSAVLLLLLRNVNFDFIHHVIVVSNPNCNKAKTTTLLWKLYSNQDHDCDNVTQSIWVRHCCENGTWFRSRTAATPHEFDIEGQTQQQQWAVLLLHPRATFNRKSIAICIQNQKAIVRKAETESESLVRPWDFTFHNHICWKFLHEISISYRRWSDELVIFLTIKL